MKPLTVTISQNDVSELALQGIDIRRFLKHLSGHTTRGFERCHLATAWGLVILQFQGTHGVVTLPIGVDVFLITKELVVGDEGRWVDRYEKLAEEAVKWAHEKLALPQSLRELRPEDLNYGRDSLN